MNKSCYCNKSRFTPKQFSKNLVYRVRNSLPKDKKLLSYELYEMCVLYKHNVLPQFMIDQLNNAGDWDWTIDESQDTYENGLGRWIEENKILYKYGKLSNDKIKLLEKLPNWTWDI